VIVLNGDNMSSALVVWHAWLFDGALVILQLYEVMIKKLIVTPIIPVLLQEET
jgi:hypothetical protein